MSVLSAAYLSEKKKRARIQAALKWLAANPYKGAALIRAHAAGVDLFAEQSNEGSV